MEDWAHYTRGPVDDRRPVLIAVLLFVVAMVGVYTWATGGDTIPEPTAVAAAPAPVAAPAVERPTPPPRRSPPKPRPTFTPSIPVDEPAAPEEDPDAVIVPGRVIDDNGQPARRVSVKYRGDKGRRTTKSDEFGQFSFTTKGERVEVWAERKDGALVSRSEKQYADGPGEWEIVLELESTRRAGLGVKVKKHKDGIYVRQVMPGTPASELGLLAGDVIIAVDGEDVGGMAVSHVTAKLTGPVGTSQYFTVRHLDGSEEDYTFERTPISTNRTPR